MISNLSTYFRLLGLSTALTLTAATFTGCIGDPADLTCEPRLEIQNETTEPIMVEIIPMELQPIHEEDPIPTASPFDFVVAGEEIYEESFEFAGQYRISATGEDTGRVLVAETELNFACKAENIIVVNENSRILYDLHLLTAGDGVGRIGITNSGLECGSDCHVPQERGSTVTLQASPSAGSTFSGWSGACSGSGSCNINMNQVQSVTATFSRVVSPDYGLQIEVEGSGKVVSYPAGIFCPDDCDGTFSSAQLVHLTAVHENHQQFIAWEGACESSLTNICELDMNGPKSVRAIFAPVMRTVEVSLVDAGNGIQAPARAISIPAGIICNNQPGGRVCSAQFQEGSHVTIRIEQPTSQTFLYDWGGACDSVEDHVLECDLNVTSDLSVTVSPREPDPTSFVFHDEDFITGLTMPGSMKFAANGGLFVSEKAGVIKYFKNESDRTGNVVVDMSGIINSYWDRGLMDIEPDPNFPANPNLYVLYTYDAPIGEVAPIYHDGDNRSSSTPGAVSGRLSRLVLSPDGSGGYTAAEEIVLVHDWCAVFPSHTVGGLRFGPDGGLYASAGDGASFFGGDWGQTNAFCDDPVDQGGAFRAQDLEYAGDPVTYSGSVIRINPQTGSAMPDNPLVGVNTDGGDAVIAHGFRNPYRITFRPGTSELWVGDVGWNFMEELNVIPDVTKLRNYGWPCYEGTWVNSAYSDRPECQALYAKELVDDDAVIEPHYLYRHDMPSNAENPCGGNDSSITGMAFYQGGSYPSRYDGALFLADYSRACIWVQLPDAQGRPDASTQEPVIFGADGPVHLETGYGGDLFYPSLVTGKIKRVSFGPASTPAEGGYEDLNPVIRINTPVVGSVAAGGSNVSFSGEALYRNGLHQLPVESLQWELMMEHCSEVNPTSCHTHFVQQFSGVAGGNITMPEDHEYPSHLKLRLRASHTVRGVTYTNEIDRIVEYPAP